MSVTLYDPHCFYTHKKAESLSDYQDASDYSVKKGRFAIADGATRSFFPSQWSQLLVERFCQDNDSQNNRLFADRQWQAWLQPIQKKWDRQIRAIVEEAPHDKYYIKNPYANKEPGLATFVGLQIGESNDKGISWDAMIIGDSCLFQVQGNQIKSYLISNSQQFDNHPAFFASYDKDNRDPPQFINGYAQPGDFFILATDALAKWMLTYYERSSWQQVWRELCHMTWGNFDKYIDRARQGRQIRLENDDVTLMIIPIGQQAKKKLSDSPGRAPEAQQTVHQESKVGEKSTQALTNYFAPTQSSQISPAKPSKNRLPAPADKHVGNASHPDSQEQQPAQTSSGDWPKDISQNLQANQVTIILSLLLLCSVYFNCYIVYQRVDAYLFGSDTLTDATPTVTRTPVDATPTVPDSLIWLLQGTKLYSEQDQLLLTAERGIQASLLNHKAPDTESIEVQIDLWVRSDYVRDQGDQVEIFFSDVPVHDLTNKLFIPVGKVSQTASFPKIEEIQDQKGVIWYKIRIRGFARSIAKNMPPRGVMPTEN